MDHATVICRCLLHLGCQACLHNIVILVPRLYWWQTRVQAHTLLLRSSVATLLALSTACSAPLPPVAGSLPKAWLVTCVTTHELSTKHHAEPDSPPATPSCMCQLSKGSALQALTSVSGSSLHPVIVGEPGRTGNRCDQHRPDNVVQAMTTQHPSCAVVSRPVACAADATTCSFPHCLLVSPAAKSLSDNRR